MEGKAGGLRCDVRKYYHHIACLLSPCHAELTRRRFERVVDVKIGLHGLEFCDLNTFEKSIDAGINIHYGDAHTIRRKCGNCPEL